MKARKFITILLIVALIGAVALTFAACKDKGADNGEPEKNIKIAVADGAPAMAIAKLLADKPNFEGYTISYEIVDAKLIAAKMMSGEANVIICPTNMGASLYKGGLDVKLLTTQVQGCLYLVGTETVSGASYSDQLASLKGKTVYNIGQGNTPDLTLKHILDFYGVAYQEDAGENPEYINLKYVDDGSVLIPLLKNGTAKYGVLGEPAVTKSKAAAGTSVLFDIQSLWTAVTGQDLPQAGVIAKGSVLHPDNAEFINWLVAKLAENDTWLLNNPTEATAALVAADSTVMKANSLTSAVIDAANIRTVTAANAKATVNAYFEVLGITVDDGFYYIG